MPAKKPSSAKKTLRKKRPIGLTSALGPKATTAVVIFVMAGGIAIAARQQRVAAKAAAEATAETASAVMSAEANSTTPAPAKKAAPARTTTAAASTVTRTGAPTVTITGCLERADGGFRLTATSGEGAPTSRSWKSGFLKKGSAAIDVLDPAHDLPLAGQVGHRVSVSGTLADRQLRADSLTRVAASCKER